MGIFMVVNYLESISMLSYVARPMRMQFVDPFIWGLLRIKMDNKLPTRPKSPTPFSKTDGTKNSKIKSTSVGGGNDELSLVPNIEVVLL